ncbi:hypothetical protein GCM10027190_01040 [Spirosoma areae]
MSHLYNSTPKGSRSFVVENHLFLTKNDEATLNPAESAGAGNHNQLRSEAPDRDRPATTTCKTNFNLFDNAQIEMSRTRWDELIYSFEAGDEMESTWFNKVDSSV